MTREELRDGWVDLMDRLYDAENYFERFDALFVEGRLPLGLGQDRLAPPPPAAGLPEEPVADDPGGPGDAGADLVRPADPPLSPGLCPLPPQAPASPAGPPRYLFQFAWKCILHTHFAT